MALLELTGVRVTFGGIEALGDVNMTVASTGFTGLIGPNGAGKTTLFNVITGFVKPSAGTVHFDGRDITSVPPHARVRAGIGRTFQHLELFASLTVEENVMVAAESGSRWNHERLSPASVTAAVLDTLGLADLAGERAGGLTTGAARLVEVARALALEPRLLLLDEPSAGLDQNESRRLAAALAPLADERAVLLVEHDVDFVMTLCAEVFVLNLGRMLAHGSAAEMQSDPAVQKAYLGPPPPPGASKSRTARRRARMVRQ
jgi:branched-chain amino acid transport system ATP-binding protein